MNKTIHELNSLSQAEATDELIIYDVSEGESKKIQVEKLLGSYVADQVELSDYETIPIADLGTSEGTAFVAEFDGYLSIKNHNGYCYLKQKSGNGTFIIAIIGSSGGTESTMTCVKKGEKIWKDSSSSSPEIYARWYKKRDYSNRT